MNIASVAIDVMVRSVLIDTWWNVNTFEFLAFTSCICVLIDTWWNVNSGNVINVFDKRIVLIDTWWNVNFFIHQVYFFWQRF